MTALKKAYAEIILNTAKEAAARIMVSERKAHQFQHDLSSTKDEALRLLLRLKQTMDSKIKEAEIKSLYQQKRIEELEAQLQEAEDIVGNLRAELNEAHAKLEEMAKAQRHNAPDITTKDVDEEDIAHVNVVSEAALAPQEKYLNNAANGHGVVNNSLEQYGYVGVPAPQEKYLNNAANGHGVVNNSLEQYGYAGVPDVPSIIVRRKEPELYRNGCTQRIRACERNLLNGHFSLSGELGDLKDEKILREDKEGEIRHKSPDVVSEIGCHVVAKPVEIKEFKNVGKTSLKGPSFIRKKRKRGARYRRSNASTLKSVPPLMAMQALSGLSNPQTCSTSSHHNLESFVTEDKGKELLSPSTTPSNVLEMDAQAEHAADALDKEFDEVRSHGEDEDREVASSLVLIRQQNGCGDCLDGPSSVPQVDLKNVSSVLLDTKESETVDGFSSPPAKERVLKYTFQRKRKKESLSSDTSSSIHQENSLKRKMVKKQNSVEPAKSSMSVESSRDSRRMAQVARQLISLSEKKWWK